MTRVRCRAVAACHWQFKELASGGSEVGVIWAAVAEPPPHVRTEQVWTRRTGRLEDCAFCSFRGASVDGSRIKKFHNTYWYLPKQFRWGRCRYNFGGAESMATPPATALAKIAPSNTSEVLY